jgi:CHASE2 domain-containing sensor protein
MTILHILSWPVKKILPHGFFAWSSWSPRKRTHFGLNIFWGVLIAVVIHYVPYAGFGQTMVNAAYDYLVAEDFAQAVKKSDVTGTAPLSDMIRIVDFDRETYDTSPSRGFWTPRELLGRCILRSVELGAKVILVDFALARGVPEYLLEKQPVNENSLFLNLLQQAAQMARKTRAVIVVPWTEVQQSGDDFIRDLNILVEKNNDVFKRGIATAFFSPTDYAVRHFGMFEPIKSRDQVLFPIHVLAAVYLWHGPEEGDQKLQEAKDLALKGSSMIAIPGPEGGKKPYFIKLFDNHSNEANIAARYLFRLAPREVTREFVDNGQDPLIKYPDLRLTVAALLEKKPEQGREPIYRGKAVIIGSTNPDMGDSYPTPIGRMPGLFLVVNGLNLILERLQIQELPLLITIILEATIILLAALFFLHWSSGVAAAVSAVLIYIAFTRIGVALFSHYGIFLKFWLPIVGIGLHRVIADSEELIKKWRTRKEEIPSP